MCLANDIFLDMLKHINAIDWGDVTFEVVSECDTSEDRTFDELKSPSEFMGPNELRDNHYAARLKKFDY